MYTEYVIFRQILYVCVQVVIILAVLTVYIFVIGDSDSSELLQRNWYVISPLLWKIITFFIKLIVTGNKK
jgi:hypothetical protein